MSSVWIPTFRVEIGLSGPLVGPLVWHIGDSVRGKIGTAQIGSADTWSDITSRVKSWSFRRGASRSDGMNLRYEAGTLSVEILNGDRAFDPTNLAGPYVSAGVTQLTPMVRVRLTAVWAGIAYRLITAYADSWVPDYTTPNYSTTTLTATDAFKLFATQDRKAVAPVGSAELSGARIGRILDNLGWNTDDRVIATGNSGMQATTLSGNGLGEMQLVQDSELGELYVDVNGNVTFRNRLAVLTDARSNTAQATFGDAGMSTPVVWDFEAGVGSFTGFGASITASTAQAHDGSQSLLMTVTGSPPQAYTRQTFASPVTPGKSKTATIWVYYPAGGNVAGAIDWYGASGYISTDSVTTSVPAATWTQLTTTATAPAGTTGAMFGPTLASPSGGTQLHLDTMRFADTVTEIPYAASPVDYDDQTLANKVSITIVGGTEQVAQDAASQAKYLVASYERTDLILQTDAEGLSYAKQVLSQTKDPELRFKQVDFNVPRAGTGNTVWPALLGRELGDRVTVIRRPPGGGSANSRDQFVRGIAMSSDGSDWKVSFNPLQSASRQQFWTIGHPTLGRIGLNAIAF